MLSEAKNTLLDARAESTTLVLAEYYVLRDEILKRMELQHQLLSYTLIILGTLFTIGLQSRNASIILLYPLIATFLVASWAYSDHRIREVGDYIRDEVESKLGKMNMGWEHFMTLAREKQRFSLHFLSSLGIFIGSEVLAILLGATVANFKIEEELLFSASVLGVICSIIILTRIRRQ
jgi:hypothetical protein